MWLQLEPHNIHDPNAVKVSFEGLEIGHLYAAQAAEYHSIIAVMEPGGGVWAEATLERRPSGWEGTIRIPYPVQLRRWAEATEEDRLKVRLERLYMPLKRSGDYQDAVSAVLAGRSQADVPIDLEVVATPKGKYAGQPMLLARAAGVTVGEVPAQYRHDNAAFFDAVLGGERHLQGRLAYYEDSGRFAGSVIVD